MAPDFSGSICPDPGVALKTIPYCLKMLLNPTKHSLKADIAWTWCQKWLKKKTWPEYSVASNVAFRLALRLMKELSNKLFFSHLRKYFRNPQREKMINTWHTFITIETWSRSCPALDCRLVIHSSKRTGVSYRLWETAHYLVCSTLWKQPVRLKSRSRWLVNSC